MSEIEMLSRPEFDPPSADELNRVIGNQLVVNKIIGRGGMGSVYKAQQTRLKRTVALKVLPPLKSTGPWDFRARFMMEARAMAKLDHPNIVKVHDFGETDNELLYIVMEYVEGVELNKLIEAGGLSLEHVGSWIPQVCEALEYAHNQELVHRDIKPGNIMIDYEGRVKIMDFGLVKFKGGPGKTRLTQARMSVGTPNYLAPEAAESGEGVDHRADIFSVGVVLYEMLTGMVPVGAWRPPSDCVVGLDPRFDDIVIRSLQPEPENRYRRVLDLGRELLAVLAIQQSGTNRLLTGENASLRTGSRSASLVTPPAPVA